MKRYKTGNKDQLILFEQHVAERIDPDDEVFGFECIIDELDITSIEKKYSETGGRCYDPRTMLKVIFFGYHRGIFSSRKLAWACKSVVQFIYLTGDIQVGWRSIVRFRADHANELGDIFKTIVELGYRIGLVEGKFGYQDGVKIHANASNARFKSKEDWIRISQKLEDDISEYFKQCSKHDEQEDLQFGKDNDGHSMPESLTKMKDRIKNLLKEPSDSDSDSSDDTTPVDSEASISEEEAIDKSIYLDKIHYLLEVNEDAADSTQLNLTDPECRFMKSHGKIDGSYNGQIITENQFITAADLVADETDFGQLEPLLKEHAQNTPDQHESLKEYGADAGYFSAQNLEYLYQSNIQGFIPEHSDHGKRALENLPESEQQLSKYDFDFNEDDDEFICPGRHKLEYSSDRIVDGKKQMVYNCKPEHCVACQWRRRCLQTQAAQKQGYRQLIVDPSHDLKRAMHDRLETDEGKEFYDQRKIEPETVFGNIRQNKSFRQMLLRSKRKVKGEFMILCGTHNIEKIIRYLKLNPGLSF